MAKRSSRRHERQNKDQAGCMWGLISIFDYRHRRVTKRLLSDRRHMTIASAYPTSEVNLLTNDEERHKIAENVGEIERPTLDVKTSVKELMEEEMVIEQASMKQTDGDEVESFDSECGSYVKNHKPTEKSHEIAISQVSSQKTSQYGDLEALTKEILLIYQRWDERRGDHDTRPNRTFSMVEEKLSAAVEVFMNEKSNDGDNGKNSLSKELIDTFQMLSSNKELFLKLLQDQNSLLLKHVQGAEDANANEDQNSKSMARSNSLVNEPSNPRPDDPIPRRHRNFFRRRSKSQENISLKGDNSPLPSSRIVILKPSSPDNQFKIKNDVHSERSNSHFSFMEIKKRLKNAMGKDQPKPRCSEMTPELSTGWSSPNRDHFYTERFAKRIERFSKLQESEMKPRENEESGDTSHRISNMYIEAKKHLLEMLSGGNEDAGLARERLPRTLGRILSFPEYNSLSAGASPRKHNEQGSVTAEMRPSPHGNFLTNNESQPCLTSVNCEENLQVPDEVNHDSCIGDALSSRQEDTISEGVLEIEKPEYQEEEKEVLDVSCEPCSSPKSIDVDQQGEIVEASDEERSPQCLKLDLPEENGFSSPLNSSLSNKMEEPDSSTSDRTGRPSPISVLDPLFSDNEISPASTVSRPVEAAVEPLCIRFEDQEICARNCTENEESAFEYVEAVLLASDLNWDEFEKRWLSSVDILDSSLFDEVEIFSSRPSDDQRLLFDSTNEILKEVCDCYLNFFLELSFIKRNIQPVPKGINLIIEVWERIESNLLSVYTLSLDQLVRKDLGISRTWMDLRSDTQELVFEIDESIFEDMMDDTLLSLLSNCVNIERLT